MIPIIAPLLIAFALVSQPAKQNEPRQQQQPATSKKQSSAQPPINITVTTPDKSPAEKEGERKRGERQDATNERIAETNDRMARFTLWLIIVGATEAVGTFAAFWIAKKSVDIAERALVVTERPFLLHSRWEVRPWVTHLPMGDEAIGLIGTPKQRGFVVMHWLSNSGKTPALRANCEAVKVVVPRTAADKHINPALQPHEVSKLQEVPHGAATVPPNNSIAANPVFLSFEELERVMDDTLVIFIHTMAEYRDAFPSTPLRTTYVCNRVGLVGDPLKDKNPWIFSAGPAEHSRAD
jgi:hypothetical protein